MNGRARENVCGDKGLTQTFLQARNEYLKARLGGLKASGACHHKMREMVEDSPILYPYPDKKSLYRKKPGPEFLETMLSMIVLGVGVDMETVTALVKSAKVEVEESQQVLEDLVNKCTTLSSVLQPALLEMVKNIRSTRMTVVTEMQQSLKILQDVRKFFIDGDYETEMQRLERFVALCQKMRDLIADGTFDAVCDSAIRLATKEVKNERE